MAVERSIASELPASFGIMLDGWTHASEHYVAVFACHEINGSLKTPLLSMAPLLNEANDDLSDESHLDFLATMLPRDFGVQLVQCRFIVGDNCKPPGGDSYGGASCGLREPSAKPGCSRRPGSARK
ncbi:hypothetical protein PC110_g23639 [Phytophthora cactorum]|nr:hypothetical protein PC110_g23639 [Phytophthora cactorum]